MHPLERLLSPRHGLGRSPLFDGQRRCDRFAQLMLHMEEVRRVMRSEVLFHIGQQPRRLITGRLDDPTVQPRKRLLHAGMPGVVIAGSSRLLQENIVAHGFYSYQRQTACKRFILR
jgi:hypothetical protein